MGDAIEESPNTLRSRAVGRVMDLLSEGPIEGLVGGKHGIYVNEVSWTNDAGDENFAGLTAEIRYGDAVQDAIPGFPAVEREIGAGQAIKYGNLEGEVPLKPEIQINDSLVDAVRVTIQCLGLVATGKKTGDIFGASATIQIEVKNAATAYAIVLTDTISGKTNSPYERSYRIKLPKNPALYDLGAPFTIRVSRLTVDNDDSFKQNATTLSRYTEIIDHKLSYPDSAYIGMTFDSQLFKDGVPRRQYLIDGLKMQVPSNYYPYGIDIENYVRMSQDFTTASWIRNNVNSPVTNDNVASPDGDLSAQLIVPTVTNAAHYISPSAVIASIPVAIDHVSSAYVQRRNAACSGVKFQVYASSGGFSYGTYWVELNFDTGAVTTGESDVVANGGQKIDHGVEDVGDGWYRIWISGYPSSTVSSLIPRLFVYGSTFGTESFAGDGTTAYVAAWGFQVHAGIAPYEYLKNTTTSKVTGVSRERFYLGTWDGTFKIAWTNNPAWILYMLLTHPRIGMGQWIDETLVDKWTLFTLAQYCDELVPDGFGGEEPRFTFNGVIRNRDDAYNIIQNIASVFRGIVYWGAGSTLISWDAPKDASILVSPANVIDGLFDYNGVGWKARHSAAMIKWNDPNNLFKDAVEIVEDQDLILKFGWKPLEISAIGCTSRGQAYRMGKWALYTEKYETETVVYKASFDHMIKDGTAVMPGDIIKIADPFYAGVRNGGRIARTTRNYLRYSHDYENAIWNKTGITFTPDVINRQNLLFGRINEDSSTGVHYLRQELDLAGDGILVNSVYNYSVHLSRAPTDPVEKVLVRMCYGPGDPGACGAIFDLNTGDYTIVGTALNIANVKMTLIGGDGDTRVWRCSFDFTTLDPHTSAVMHARVYACDSAGNTSYLGDPARSFYVVDAQLSNGTGVVDYIETEAAVRQGLLIDDSVSILSDIDYTVSAVLPNGTVEDRLVTSPAGDRTLLQVASNFSLDPANNAMWVLSSSEVEPRLFRVLSVREQEKNIIEVTALYHNPDKFAMIEQDLQFETPNFSTLSLSPLYPPSDLVVDEYLFITVGNSVQSAVTVSWTPPTNEPRVIFYEVQIRTPEEDWTTQSSTSDVSVTIEGIKQGIYGFRVRAVGSIGSTSPWQVLDDIELFGLTQRPPGVENFNMNAVGDQAYLTWDPITDPTAGSFVVKVQNVVTGAQWGSGIVVLDNIPRSSSHVYVPLRYGTYMIKAISIASVESIDAALVISDVAGINNFNATATVIAEPTFDGTKTNCSVVSTDLVTTASGGLYPASATYELDEVIDLGEVYTNRLTPTITAAGQRATYTMDTWGFLSQVERLDGGVENSWSVIIEYSTTRVDTTTADPEDWTEWRPLIIGDSTARGYKFRIRLLSYDTSVQVRVSEFRVVIDMPDRVEGEQGVSVPGAPSTAGLNVVYNNPFKEKPAVAVTVQDASESDVVTLSSEARTGFNVKITNAGAYVTRNINWVAKGYGKQ